MMTVFTCKHLGWFPDICQDGVRRPQAHDQYREAEWSGLTGVETSDRIGVSQECLKRGFRESGDILHSRKQHDNEITPERAAGEVQAVHREKKYSLQEQCCSVTDHPEGVWISTRLLEDFKNLNPTFQERAREDSEISEGGKGFWGRS